jgi:phosphoribosylanthranilate isomerase
MYIKVCGITRESDLRAVSLCGAQFAGFIFHELSPRFAATSISGRAAREFKGGLKTVGVFVNAGRDRILSLVESYGLDFVQLHGDETPEFCQMIRHSVPVIRTIRVNEETEVKIVSDSYMDCCDYFLFDTRGKEYGGNGIRFGWEQLDAYDGTIPYFLSGGIAPSDVALVKAFQLQHGMLAAVDINSRFEKKPGLKHIDLVQAFVNELKASQPVNSDMK